METILYFEIVMATYHDSPVGRLRCLLNGKVEESNLYSPDELNNLIQLWKMGELQGSFAIGTKLAQNANFQLTAS